MARNHYNAATQTVTIYSPSGEPHVCTRLNANDLVRYSGYNWRNDTVESAEENTEESQIPDTETAETSDPIEEAENTAEEPVPEFDSSTATLEEWAEHVIGDKDVEKFLTSFTPEALRTLCEERYGQRVHGRTATPKVIERIITLEAERTDLIED